MKEVVFILVLVLVLLVLIQTIKSKITPIGIKVLIFIGMTYPVCKVFQFFTIGPYWARWWLTDFGFVVLLTVVYLSFEIKNKWLETVNFRRPLIKGGIIAFLFSCLVEGTQLIAQNTVNISDSKVRGDYYDLLMYLLGFIVILIVSQDKSMKREIPIHSKKPRKK